MMVSSLVSSSIMMFPYWRSLWQNPTRSHSPENSFSSAAISSSMLSKQNSSVSSEEEYRLLAVLSQFLAETMHRGNQHFASTISFALQHAVPEQLCRRKKKPSSTLIFPRWARILNQACRGCEIPSVWRLWWLKSPDHVGQELKVSERNRCVNFQKS